MLDFIAVLGRRWRVVLSTIIVAVAVAAAITYRTTPTYEANAQLFVALESGETASDLNAGVSFSAQRVKSYPDLVDSPLVLQPTIDELGLDTTPEELADRLRAEVPPNTVLILVSADDESPTRAAQIANSVAGNLAAVVEDLDKTRDDRPSPVRVSVTREAVPPSSPQTPVPLLNLTLGLMVGVLLGALLAALREALDTTIKDEGDIAASTGLPVLAQVPTNSAVRSSPLIDGTVDEPMWAESYRKLRTNLSYVDPDHPPRIIAVTSALPGDGKSLTAANLAVSLGQSGQRTILVEADLRRPSLAGVLDLDDSIGVSSLVVGKADVEAAIQSHGTIDVLTSGPLPPNPSELLGTQAFRALLEQLAEMYDRVVIDTPPLVAVTDAAVVATASDAVVLVVHVKRSKANDVRRAVVSLRAVDASVVGVVLNQTSASGTLYYRYETPREQSGRR